ncbi:sensor histidine kinase [Brochothrix thermosphacta]|uniref:Sensor histidine kinase NatK-like C-terminal domain-containing protein n=1 Tax=Brochothrix thermosphacta TaxID=2756 RepID=A0A2X0QI14_BROTH|nr:GHKL domain-containing protein [Brochothrix thermosphacta]SPP28236.1 membrane hypothetical protein [Brochothrix thermosphacta]
MSFVIGSLSVVLSMLFFLLFLGWRRLIYPRDLLIFAGLFLVEYLLYLIQLLPPVFFSYMTFTIMFIILYKNTKAVFLAIAFPAVYYALSILSWHLTFGLAHSLGVPSTGDRYPYFSVALPLQLILVVSVILFVLLIAILLKYLDLRWQLFHVLIHDMRTSTVIAVFILISMLIANSLHVNAYRGQTDNLTLSILSIISYSLVLVFIIVVTIQAIKSAAKTAKIKQAQLYSEQLERVNTDVQAFQHDYRSILMSLSSFIENEDWQNLKTFFYEELAQTADTDATSDTLHKDLNNIQLVPLYSVLQTKLAQSENYGIVTRFYAPTPVYSVTMPMIDLIRCVSILMDNACEAAQKATEPTLTVTLTQDDEKLYLQVENTIAANQPLDIKQMMTNGYSTKGTNRGKGLANLAKIVKRTPGADYSLTKTDNTFTLYLELVRGN